MDLLHQCVSQDTELEFTIASVHNVEGDKKTGGFTQNTPTYLNAGQTH